MLKSCHQLGFEEKEQKKFQDECEDIIQQRVKEEKEAWNLSF